MKIVQLKNVFLNTNNFECLANFVRIRLFDIQNKILFFFRLCKITGQNFGPVVEFFIHCLITMNRLTSGNFGIFYPDEFYSDLNSGEKSTLKFIQNDTDIAYEL